MKRILDWFMNTDAKWLIAALILLIIVSLL